MAAHPNTWIAIHLSTKHQEEHDTANLRTHQEEVGAPAEDQDMDNFKRVVDTYGHLNGSQALKEVANTIKSYIKRPCFGVAYGGDEFVIVLPGFDKAKATEKVEQIRLQMKQATYLSKAGHKVHLGANFGVATFPDDTDNREGLLALADKAMFHIKQTGKGLVGTIPDHILFKSAKRNVK